MAGRAIIRAFHPAAVRKSYDGEGLEFIGRCDGSQVAPLYDNRVPWVQIHLGDYPVPPPPNLWTGDKDTDCTGPLVTLLNGRFNWNVTRNPYGELRTVRAMIASTRDQLAGIRTDDPAYGYARAKVRERLHGLEERADELEDMMAIERVHSLMAGGAVV